MVLVNWHFFMVQQEQLVLDVRDLLLSGELIEKHSEIQLRILSEENLMRIENSLNKPNFSKL